MSVSAPRIDVRRVIAALESVFAAACFVLAVLLMLSSYHEARLAEQTYGHNVDSGAIGGFIAVAVLTPLGVLLTLAAWSLWRRWTRRRWVQAGVGVVILSLFYAVSRIMMG